jgi:hypothetical protein
LAKKWRKDKGYQAAQRPKRKTPVYRHTLDNPPALTLSGPLISCEWSIPPVLAERLRLGSRPVPQPVLGQLVIDTGAGRTCISSPVARELDLSPLRIQVTYGAGGRHELPVFRARLTLKILDGKGGVLRIDYDTEATGVEDLNEGVTQLSLMHYGRPVRLVGLLGRDMLQHATLTYRGTEGRFDVAFDLDSLERASSAGQALPVASPASPSAPGPNR